MNGTRTLDVIAPEQAGTLAGLFRERVRRTPEAVAYRCHGLVGEGWGDLTWSTLARWVAAWQRTLEGEALAPGERVAVMVRNCPAWVVFDQAALGLGLVVVPLHLEDTAENVAHVLADSGARVVVIEGPDQWERLRQVRHRLPDLKRVFTLRPVNDPEVVQLQLAKNPEPLALREPVGEADDLATIIYTSGTTGRRPKGVMLSHHNILWNAHSGMRSIAIYREDLFLSFLPLAHAFERTIGYYLPMMAGATVAYARSIPQLAEDIRRLRPTVIISVPRIYERIHNRLHEQLAEKSGLARGLFRLAVNTGWGRFECRQNRRRTPPLSAPLWPLLERAVANKLLTNLGGRIRVAICGGAPFPSSVARTFVALGLPVLQGYGMTEASPVLSVNQLERNDPESVGPPLQDVELRLGEHDELLARGPGVMLGYWNQPEATASAIDADGWLHTGDQARLKAGFVYITGRIKEIIVLSSGKKIPPDELEMAIRADPLFEQVMIVGDDRPCLAALVVLSEPHAEALKQKLAPGPVSEEHLHAAVLERLTYQIRDFPGHAKVRQVAVVAEPWSVTNGCLTPTLKLKRKKILARHANLVEQLYRHPNAREAKSADAVARPEAPGVS